MTNLRAAASFGIAAFSLGYGASHGHPVFAAALGFYILAMTCYQRLS